MNKKKILITGGSGFMGSRIAESLVATDRYKVYAVDDHSGGSPANVPNGCYFTHLDLRDKNKTNNLIERVKPDVIYALAANAREGGSFFQPVDISERNSNVLLNVLEPAIKNGLQKIIFFSTMAVYGDQEPPFSEDMQRKPCDIYGAYKRTCEEVIEMLSEAHGFKYTIIRPHNVIGSNQCLSDIYRNVVSIFMNRIMREEPLYIYGDGEQKRAFSYVDFSLPCYLKCLEDFTDGEVYNIGGTQEITVNELAKIVIDCFPEYNKPEIIHLADRHGEVKRAWSTYQKSIDELGYRETFDIREAIKRMSVWAKGQGPQDWTEEKLSLINEKVPLTWTMERNKAKETE